MSMNLIQQQQQQEELHGMMPSLMSQSQHSYHHNDYNKALSHPLELPTTIRQSPHTVTTHYYNDQDQYPSHEEFDAIVQDYLSNLSSKKRDKALIDQARYAMILQVLKDPRNTAVSTAQFRFWVKKMFQLTPRQIVCHDGKPVAMREQIYGILVRAHREAHHGGRDKTSALVRRRYSWIPKELIARFVRHCPFCISRRNGSQQSSLSLGIFLPATPPTYSTMMSSNNDDESRIIRAPSMIPSSSSASSSSAPYPEEMMFMAAAAAHHHHQQQQESTAAIDLSSWQQSTTNQPSYYASNNYYHNNNNSSDSKLQNPYSMTYSSNMIAQEEQHMMMQPPLSVYYAQEYGLKQTTDYSLLDHNNSSSIVTPPTTASRNMYYSSTVAPSPSLSPSSSSTSATSSPVHPVYHENNHNHGFLQHQQGLSLLSHHQSLF